MFKVMERNREVIESDIANLVFYMQGGISYDDAWLLTLKQRKIMINTIEKHYSAISGKNKSQL